MIFDPIRWEEATFARHVAEDCIIISRLDGVGNRQVSSRADPLLKHNMITEMLIVVFLFTRFFLNSEIYLYNTNDGPDIGLCDSSSISQL